MKKISYRTNGKGIYMTTIIVVRVLLNGGKKVRALIKASKRTKRKFVKL